MRAYVAFNAAMGAAAFGVVVLTHASLNESDLGTLVQWAALAGFGSAAVLRAKLLSLKLAEGKELALGPEIVIQTFLSVIDRELDRNRARKRWNTVRSLFLGIHFDRAKLRLPIQVFQAMQGVTEEETQALMARIGEVDEMTTLDQQDKAYLLGFYLLDLVGEEFLTEVLSHHREDFAAPPDADGA